MKTQQHWQGELWLARDFALFAGASGDTSEHAHYAHQLVLAVDAPLRLRLQGTPLSGACICIESMQPHAFVDSQQPLVAVYAEPLAFAADELRRSLAGVAANLPNVAQCMARVVRREPEPRIAQALAALDQLLEAKVSAVELAAEAGVSLSQLERLFAEQIGLSVRRLVLWRRLRLALALSMQGANLTHAAHAAGFADSAHLSRTVRSMFGIRADRTLRHLRLRLLD
ncbi:MAG: AraC family transcriptional regulator [Pseudomonadales bacterium RIFCSPLOWO2_12_59_9]|uniref:helix-turn-helix domain-containing protein n=1 Tax=Pseudomonas sp. TaxID=306 RepID=UPI0008C350F1|nr:MAG: AraC family transcriptional regulator [Pseudomonadales bacterium RIFCSPLOWO2_12_59_9]